MTFCAACLMGLEGLAAQELREMGCENVRAENARVLFDGDEAALARALIGSRFSERIGVLVGEFEARSFEELFQGVKALPWEELIGKDNAFPVTGSCLSSQLMSVRDCQSIVRKAMAQRLGKVYGRSWLEETGPVHRVRFVILKDRVSLVLDATGEGLHKRGYRAHSNDAPLKETLAAALCQLSRLRGDGTLIDPFCGSGTILIEGAMLAMGLAPGLRREFAAQAWRESHEAVWREQRDYWESQVKRDGGFQGFGYDIDPEAVELTRYNARLAGVGESLTVECRDVRDFVPETEYGCVITNPPYGERLGNLGEARELLQALGEVIPARKGWSLGVLTPETELEQLIGRRADKRRKLYNGRIQCQYYQFFKAVRS